MVNDTNAAEDIAVESLSAIDGNITLITLKRPKQLNALTESMCQTIDATLKAAEADPTTKAIIVKGEGDKAFCAGGDIRTLYERGRAQDPAVLTFFHHEYGMNKRLFHFTKPYIAICDGITMGGGVGISIHGSHRVGTEQFLFAMPETGIGFFPDVGGSYFLSRLPGKTGMYLGLTGTRLQPVDAHYLGILTDYVPSERIEELIITLRETAFSSKHDVSQIIADFAAILTDPPISAQRTVIDACFAADDVAVMLKNLADHPGDWSSETIARLQKMSPTSLKVTAKQIQQGAKLDLDACLVMEERIVAQMLKGHDMYEGIRALIIDKDNNPRWQPASLSEVDTAMIDAYFQQAF